MAIRNSTANLRISRTASRPIHRPPFTKRANCLYSIFLGITRSLWRRLPPFPSIGRRSLRAICANTSWGLQGGGGSLNTYPLGIRLGTENLRISRIPSTPQPPARFYEARRLPGIHISGNYLAWPSFILFPHSLLFVLFPSLLTSISPILF